MKRFYILLVAVLVLNACEEKKLPSLMAAAETTIIDTSRSECPYLTTDNQGHQLLSWVRSNADSSTSFCYAISQDGKTFAQTMVVPNTANIQPHGENLPKIIVKPSGEIIALWGAGNPNPKNKYSGLVFYTQSFDQGKTWTSPRSLVTDTASFDQRYYDVALLPNGEAGIIWLDNRKTVQKEGSGLYFAATQGKNGFSSGRLVAEPCCQCCRTDLFVDRKGGVHALFRGIVQDSIRDMVHIVSTDGGQNFSTPKRISEDNWVISGCPHTGPSMTENSGGLHFAWFTGGRKKGCFYTHSADNGNSFNGQDSISRLGSHPQITALKNGSLLTVWDESVAEDGKVYKRIGLQERTAKGLIKGTRYLTGTDSNAGFPVISPINDNSCMIAFTLKKGEHNFVAYQIIATLRD